MQLKYRSTAIKFFKVKKSHELAVKYTGQYVIKLNNENAYKNCSCNCIFYMKDAICMHLIGYSWLFNKIHYRNYSNEPTEFAIKKKVGRHKLTAKAGHFN